MFLGVQEPLCQSLFSNKFIIILKSDTCQRQSRVTRYSLAAQMFLHIQIFLCQIYSSQHNSRKIQQHSSGTERTFIHKSFLDIKNSFLKWSGTSFLVYIACMYIQIHYELYSMQNFHQAILIMHSIKYKCRNFVFLSWLHRENHPLTWKLRNLKSSLLFCILKQVHCFFGNTFVLQIFDGLFIKLKFF